MELSEGCSRERQELSGTEQDMPSSDRLSSLPDPILCHILSFLPIKLSVAASVLARRWRFLWTQVPILDLDYKNHTGESEMGFFRIVNRVMLLHKLQSLTTFRLFCKHKKNYECDCDCSDSQFEAETWITAAVGRNVKNMCLQLPYDISLPRCLFTCATLVDLRLHRCVGIPTAGAICLPNLNKLHLYVVKYGGDESLPRLISGCPVLEELIIDRILYRDLRRCYISSPTLQTLVIKFQFDRAPHHNRAESDGQEYGVEINAPSLTYLKMEDWISDKMSIGMLNSLIEADISFYNIESRPHHYSICMLNFLYNLRNAKFLKLSSNFYGFDHGAFSRFSYPNIMLDNLSRLELGADWKLLERFVGTANNLETLIIHIDEGTSREDPVPHQVPKCLLTHLKTITIHQFRCLEPAKELLSSEIVMVRYLLRNALVLKRMEINCKHGYIDWKSKYEALQIISSFERGSNACLLTFDSVCLGFLK